VACDTDQADNFTARCQLIGLSTGIFETLGRHGLGYAFNGNLNAEDTGSARCYCSSHGFNMALHGMAKNKYFDQTMTSV
jgi:hypothetical protein